MQQADSARDGWLFHNMQAAGHQAQSLAGISSAAQSAILGLHFHYVSTCLHIEVSSEALSITVVHV